MLGRACVDLDGSEPYGSARDDGWLDAFHRYACPLPGGHFLVLDSMVAKAPNRSELVLSGGPWGGVPFDEGGAASQVRAPRREMPRITSLRPSFVYALSTHLLLLLLLVLVLLLLLLFCY